MTKRYKYKATTCAVSYLNFLKYSQFSPISTCFHIFIQSQYLWICFMFSCMTALCKWLQMMPVRINKAGKKATSLSVVRWTLTFYSLMTAVPLPGVPWPAGEEICRPLVLDSLREPQQHAGVIVTNLWSIGRAADTNRRRDINPQGRYRYNDITQMVQSLSWLQWSFTDYKWWVEK